MSRFIFIDAGAYMGQSISKFVETETYSAVNWEMHAYEAHPELVAEIKTRTDLEVHNKAVWIDNDVVPFYGTSIRKNYLKDETKPFSPGQGSSLMKNKSSGKLDVENPMLIPCVDIGAWITENCSKSDYIIFKLDVEGAEFEILSLMLNNQSIEYVNWLFVEFHAKKVGVTFEAEETLKNEIVSKGVKLIEDQDGQATGDWFVASDAHMLNEIAEDLPLVKMGNAA